MPTYVEREKRRDKTGWIEEISDTSLALVSSEEGLEGQKPEAEKNEKNETPSWVLVSGEGKNAPLILVFSRKGEIEKSN